MVDRLEFLPSLLPGKSAKGLEIAPAHNPICPKRNGWNVKSLDCMSTEELKKYLSENPGNDLTKVEEVDYVWRGGDIIDLFKPEELGSFDYIMASHVFEHVPDVIRTLNSFSKLLSPDGVIVLVLPDRRYTFDFMRAHSTAGDALEAHLEKRERHSLKNALNGYLYTSWVGNLSAWYYAAMPTHFQHSFTEAMEEFEEYKKKVKEGYVDMHGWVWTPASFDLMMLDLLLMDMIDLEVTANHTVTINEFYPVIKRRKGAKLEPTAEIEKKRFNLALKSILEYTDFMSNIKQDAADDRVKETPLREGIRYHTRHSIAHVRYAFEHLNIGIRETLSRRSKNFKKFKF